MNKKVLTIAVIGRRWFNRRTGNTYHTVHIFVNGKGVHYSDYTYGYGNQWEWTARDWLAEHGYLNDIKSKQSLALYCQAKGIEYISSAADVGRKGDL